ncbi:hypothetical protein TNCV_4366901 [Trichonephila clavipes]|nr:hypothetical protein TNCV_4366901 [Trichonephila clavipes]
MMKVSVKTFAVVAEIGRNSDQYWGCTTKELLQKSHTDCIGAVLYKFRIMTPWFLMTGYFWPGMYRNVVRYESPFLNDHGRLVPIPAIAPFHRIGIDLLGRFPNLLMKQIQHDMQ